MKKFFFILLSLYLITEKLNAQITAIPDPNFEQKLINLGLDSSPIDGGVPTANINTLDSLNVSGSFITNLTGIEDFTALTYLNCSNNQLVSLNVTQNTALVYLLCYQNLIVNLDVTKNTSLIDLFCFMNQITTGLDVTQNTSLSKLLCWQNQIPSLDVTQNTSLTVLECAINLLTSLSVVQNTILTTLTCNYNQLISLDVKNGNNTNFTLFGATNNPNLTCIQVDNATWATSNWVNKDAIASYSSNCSVGVNEINNDLLGIAIYPNPAKSIVNIIFKEVNLNYYLSIMDITGKMVLKQKITNIINTIDISALSSGYYHILVSNANRILSTKKLIISP